jgi:hypothetical protein
MLHTGGMKPLIEHCAEHRRFEATLDGYHGRLEYGTSPGQLTLVHTEVDGALEGRGVAGALVRAAVDHARQQGLKVDAVCEYARSYLDRHPEMASMRV